MSRSRGLRTSRQQVPFPVELKPVDLYPPVVESHDGLVALGSFWTLRPRPLEIARERPHAADQMFSTLRPLLDRLKIASGSFFSLVPPSWPEVMGAGSDRSNFSMAMFFDKNADVAELADAQDSGSSARNGGEVQVLLSAPKPIAFRIVRLAESTKQE